MAHWSEKYTPIPAEDLPRMIGKHIHIKTAWSPGCVWRLVKIEGNIMRLITPKTKRLYSSPTCNAIYTKKNYPTRKWSAE